MLYDDEQILTNVAMVNEMAKEYAKSIESKRQEKLLIPLTQLFNEQIFCEYSYNSLLKFAKQNAMPFIKDLLTQTTVNIEKINKIIVSLDRQEIKKEITNNYVKIFKDALQSEINSLSLCLHCQYNCKDEVNLSVLKEIEKTCLEHIEKLISCF